MNITLEQIKEYNPCLDAVKWAEGIWAGRPDNLDNIVQRCAEEDHLDWANWLLPWLMTPEQKIKYAVFSAEQVIHIFEEKYPDDKRPRTAIELAKKYIESKNKPDIYAGLRVAAQAAAKAATDAASEAQAATDAAQASAKATKAAAYAVADAADAASAAAYAAAFAAYAAADAAYAADAATDAISAAANAKAACAAIDKKAMMLKILDYGMDLLRRYSDLEGKENTA